MEYKQIEKLLEAFYEGNTSKEEETILGNFFLNENVPDNLNTDKIVFESLLEEKGNLPNNLEEDLIAHINSFPKKDIIERRSKLTFYITSIAAAIVLLIAVIVPNNTKEVQLTDTFTDPKEAAIVAENALKMISSNLNRGIVEIEKTQNRINKTLDKYLD